MAVSFAICMLGMTLLLVALIRRDYEIEQTQGPCRRPQELAGRLDAMTIEEGAKYVAAAYAVILAVL